MRITRILLALLIPIGYVLFPVTALAQPKVVLSERFDKPLASSMVPWMGTLEHFKPLSGDMPRLQLSGNATRSDTSWLSTPISLMHGEWEYVIEIGSAPSQSNRVDLVLMSNISDLKSPFDGYLVKAGDNGSNDVLRLMRIDRGTLVPILNGTLSIADGGRIWIRVTRSSHGRWFLQSSVDGENWQDEGSAVDLTYSESQFSGVRFIYTRTRAHDYALGPITIRRHPPSVVRLEPGTNLHRFVFDTPMDSLSIPRIRLNGKEVPALIRWKNARILLAEWGEPPSAGVNEYTIIGLRSADGAFEDVEVSGSFALEYEAKAGDVLINEFIYYPPEGVPQFAEIVNNSDMAINLKNWELRDFSAGTRKVSENDMWLLPDSLLVLTQNHEVLGAFYGFRQAWSMPRFPTLNRSSSDGLILIDPNGTTIDSVAYQPNSAGDGVSIERVSKAVPSHIPENWQPSTDLRGATPGKPNSARPPNAQPGIRDFRLEGNKKLKLRFRSSINIPKLEQVRSNWIIEFIEHPSPESLIVHHRLPFEQGKSIEWQFSGLTDVFGRVMPDTTIQTNYHPILPRLAAVVAQRADSLSLHFTAPVKPGPYVRVSWSGESWSIVDQTEKPASFNHGFQLSRDLQIEPRMAMEINVRGFVDENNQPLPDTSLTLAFLAGEGVLLSEIMFNPLQQRYDGKGDQSQYIELFNDKPFPQWLFGLRLNIMGNSRATTISFNWPQGALIPAYGYAVLIADSTYLEKSRLVRFFGLEDTIHIFRAPRSTLSLNTSAGSVALSTSDGSVIDSMNYHSQMHLPWIRDHRGVSLERISYASPSWDNRNWSSHAGPLGGSPGAENSVAFKSNENTLRKTLSADPIPFSPDGDGRDDILNFELHMPTPGWVVNLSIYDRLGRLVRTLASGERVAQSTRIFWNGLDDKGKALPTGAYIAVLEAWSWETGQRLNEKIAIAIVHQPIRGAPFK